MRICVVGAGVAGLAAARTLHRAGHQVVVLEKSSGLGGRCATRRVGPYTFDTGATSIAPRGRGLEKFMLEEADQSDLHRIEKPVWVTEYGRVAPGDATKMKIERYTYRSGINRIGKLLADGLEVRRDIKVDHIHHEPECVTVNGESFDHCVVAIPAPQAKELLEPQRSVPLTRFRACLSVLLGYEKELPPQPYFALLDEDQRSPLVWLSLESQKCPDRAPAGHTALVAQLGAEFSRDHYDASDHEVGFEAWTAVSRILGKEFAEPAVYQVKRWRFSQPESFVTGRSFNPPGTRIWLCGDAYQGPRVEFAYDSGVIAAQEILATC